MLQREVYPSLQREHPTQSCSSPLPWRPSSSSRRSRQGSGGRKRHSSILLKKSSLLCQKSEHGNNPGPPTLYSSSPELESADEEGFLNSCSVPEIHHRPAHSSPLSRPIERGHPKKRSGKGRHESGEPHRLGPPDIDQEMPQLFNFSQEDAGQENTVSELNRAISSIRPDRLDELDFGDIITDLANSNNESDDSCMIVEQPQIVMEQRPPSKSEAEDMKYKHKKNVIFGIYGKSQDKTSGLKMVKENKSIFDVDESEGSFSAKQNSGESSKSESESWESSSASSECSSPLSPVEVLACPEPEQALVHPPSSLDSSSLSDSDSSSSGRDTPPPTLAPAVAPSPPPSHKDARIPRRQGRPKGSKNKKKVEMACQTDFSPSMPLVHHVSSGATPPRLIGFGMEPSKLNRGRPRKNPPMLEPEIGSRLMKEEEEDSQTQSDEHSNRGGKKKKGKLSVLFAAAKHWQKQQEKCKSAEETVYDFNEDEGDMIQDTSEEPSEETCDYLKYSKAAKSKLFKVRSKHKDRQKRKQTQHAEKSHKHKNIHPQSFHSTEKKKYKKQKKIIISSDEEELPPRLEVKTRKSHKSKKTRKNNLVVEHWPSGGKAELHSDIEERPVDNNAVVIKRENKPVDAKQGPVFEQFGTSNNFAEIGAKPGLIFSTNFCSLIPDEFWKKDKLNPLKLAEDQILKSEPVPSQQQEGIKESTKFTTKASVKEMPSNGSSQSFPAAFVPRNQVTINLDMKSSN